MHILKGATDLIKALWVQQKNLTDAKAVLLKENQRLTERLAALKLIASSFAL